MFSTLSQEVVEMCKLVFSCQTPSDAVANRKCKFLSKFIVSDNVLCNVTYYLHFMSFLAFYRSFQRLCSLHE